MSWRIAAYIFAVLALQAGTCAAAKPAKYIPYAKYRQHLLSTGWRPLIVETYLKDGTSERQWGNALQMLQQGFVEIEMCAGTGVNPCKFHFRKGKICRTVETSGESLPSLGSPVFEAFKDAPCAHHQD